MTHPFDEISLADLRKRRSMKWRKYAPDVLPAWVAEMDFPLAEPIKAVLHDMIERGDTGYAAPGGVEAAFAEFSQRRFGFTPDVARGRTVPDIMRGILVALYELTPPGSGIALFTPAYPPFFEVIGYSGRQVVPVPLGDLERLEDALARQDVSTLLLCNPHNPTGSVYNRDELLAIAEIAGRHGVVVLADEVHGPLTYGDAVHVPFASLGDLADRSVTFVSASKGWNLPGLKCAAVFASSAETWKPFADLPGEIEVAVSPLGIAANQVAFSQGESWLDDTRAYLDGNRRLLAELLAMRLPGVRCEVPEATYLAWLDCRALGLGDDPAEAFLAKGKVAVNAGPTFGPGGEGFVRLNFATSRAILTEAVDRMARALP
ncbi:aminotransferase class I/II-fold pyridoxal phosphate-dependent enzyme [Flindersiella endophytica]